MSTLFDKCYDCLGHEVTYGSTVCFNKGEYIIYGTIKDIVPDAKTEYKFIIVPNLGWRGPSTPKLQNQYKINPNRVYEVTCHKTK